MVIAYEVTLVERICLVRLARFMLTITDSFLFLFDTVGMRFAIAFFLPLVSSNLE